MKYATEKSLAIALGCLLLQAHAEAAKTPVKNLTVTGDVRLMYVNYTSKYDGAKYGAYFKNLRNRINVNYQIDKNTTATIGVYDNRYFNAHENDRRAYIARGNISGQYSKFGYTLGRMEHEGVDEFVLEATHLDGVKLRFGPRTKYVETFVGNISRNSEGEHPSGFYVKGVQHWKHWTGKTAFYEFTDEDKVTPWNHQKIWSNLVAYRFDSKNSLSYERLNAWGEDYGVKAERQSGYVMLYRWNNLDLSRANTLYVSAGYVHQPQGSFLRGNHAAMAAVDSFSNLGAEGFKGPALYVGYTLAKNTLLNFEAYDLRNIYGSTKHKQKTLAAYLNFFY